MSSHCLVCKKGTSNVGSELHHTTKGKPYLRSKCGSCGKTKCLFVNKDGHHKKGGEKRAHKRGGGLISSLLPGGIAQDIASGLKFLI